MSNEVSKERVIEILKKVYKKHVLLDEDIGWSELGSDLCDMLCNLMGDDEFCEWTEAHQVGDSLPRCSSCKKTILLSEDAKIIKTKPYHKNCSVGENKNE